MRTKLKKSLALFVVVAMLFSMLPMQFATAAEYTDPTFEMGSASVELNGTDASVTVPVKVYNNPGFNGLTMRISIPDGWSIEKINNRTATEYSLIYVADEWGGMGLPEGAQFATNNAFEAGYAKMAMGTAADMTGSGFVCWVVYKVPANAINGANKISVVLDEVRDVATSSDLDGITSKFKVVDGTVTVIGGVDVLTKDNTVVEGVLGEYEYNGAGIAPAPVVKYNGKTLTAGTDYTVTYSDNVNPGTVTMTFTGKGAYQGSFTKTFEIVKAASTINGTAVYTKQYGDAAFTLDAAATSGAALSYVSSNPAVATVNGAGKVTVIGAGTTEITVSAPATDSYEAPANFKVSVTVGKADQSLTGSASYEKTYGDAAFDLDVSGAQGDMTYVSSNPAVAEVNNGTVTVKGVGKTTITVTAKEVSGKYNETTKKINVTVEPKEVTVSGITVADKTYDGSTTATIDKTGAVINGLVSGDELDVTVSGAFASANAGTQTVALSVALTGADSANYVLKSSTVNVEATINKAVVAAPVAVTGLVFNGTEQVGVAATADYTVTTGTATNANHYIAEATLVDPDNYTWEAGFDGTVDWDIAKAPASALTKTITRRYSSTQAINITAADVALANCGEVTFSNWNVTDADSILSGADGAYALAAGLTDAATGKTATITVDVATDNYEDTTLTITVEVIDKNDVSAGLTFADGSADYTGKAHTYETAKYNGSASGIRYTYSADMINAGSYTVTAVYEDDDNYGEKTVSFTVNPVEISVVSGVAADKVYDDSTIAAVTDVTFNGLVNGETLTAADYTMEAHFYDGNVGEKQVSFDVTLVKNAVTDNYVLTSAFGKSKAEILPKEITVTVDPVAALEFTGAALKPTVTVTADGTLNGYVLVEGTDYTVSYANNTNVGSAAITVAPKADSNYTFAAANGAFAIEKAAVAVDSLSGYSVKYSMSKDFTLNLASYLPKNAGDVLVTLDGDFSATLSSWKATGSKVEFTVAPVSADDIGKTVTIPMIVTMENYETVTMDLVITRTDKDVPVAVAQDITVTYGDILRTSDIEGTATFEGKVVNGSWSWVTDTNTMTDAGTYAATVMFTPDDGDNYATALASLTVTVKRAKPDYPAIDDEDATTLEDLLVAADFSVPGTLKWYDEDGNELAANTEFESGVEYTWVFTPADLANYESVSETYESGSGNAWLWGVLLGGAAGGINFDDVSRYDWFYDAVEFAVQEGLFEGISEDEFDPNGNMTRAMLVTVLYRLEGSPRVYSYADFDDVARDTWYTAAVAWAAKAGIVEGFSETEFAPNVSITREQLATILYRYADYKGLGLDLDADLSGYADADKISAYAEDAMTWAATYGLVQGMTADTLAPQGTATRAQVATILMRFAEWFGL